MLHIAKTRPTVRCSINNCAIHEFWKADSIFCFQDPPAEEEEEAAAPTPLQAGANCSAAEIQKRKKKK